MNHNQPQGYEQKFAGFIRACAAAKEKGADRVLIAYPWIIGDTYEEIMESLWRVGEAGVGLYITAPRKER